MHNLAVEYNVATFSELLFAVCWQERLSRGYTHATAAMVDNHAK